jgi:DNA-binding MarR family transcriptional regulator
MTTEALAEQGGQLTDLVSRLLRTVFILRDDDPTIHLPVAQLRVCNLLADGPRTISALAREMQVTVSAVTQIADRLESASLVERVPGKRDRRTRHLRLTHHGMEALRVRRAQRVQRACEVLRTLNPAARVRVLRALRALLKAVALAEKQGPGGRTSTAGSAEADAGGVARKAGHGVGAVRSR